MDANRWKKLQEIFEEALNIDAEEREAFLDKVCGADSDLRDQVDALLRADRSTSGKDIEELVSGAASVIDSLSLEGRLIGHYLIERKIGSGGMGVVYLARDQSLKRSVALKFLPPLLAMDDTLRTRFQQEASAAASLNHPNIVTVHEVSEHNSIPYIVMEYVEGDTLRKKISSGNSKGDVNDVALDIASQLSEGLQAAHQAGIIHRDIKPGNIMLDENNRLRILDFGLAKSLDDPAVTRAGSTMGTVEYLSPEQVNGETPGVRSDLFALGVVLYELAAGVTPFRRETSVGTLQAIVRDEPRPLKSANSQVTNEFSALVMRLLEKDPRLRYQSAGDVVSDLRSLKSGGKPVVPGVLVFRRLIRNRILLTATLAGIVFTTMYFGWLFLHTWAKVEKTRLAVLPFKNLGSEKDSYFVEGVTDEITSQLSGYSGLAVIARASAARYVESEKSIPEIGRELGVSYILEGSLRWSKSGDTDKIHISPQLIDVAENISVWSGVFERKITDIFELQSEIIDSITSVLGVTSRTGDDEGKPAPATESVEAYNFYLRGLSYQRTGNSWENRLLALEMYKRAIAVDTAFATPYARIGELYALMFYAYYDRSDTILVMAMESIERSLGINSRLPEGHVAKGLYFYWGFRNYESAVREFEIAQKLRPNDAEIYGNLALVQRRQGDWESAIDNLNHAIELDPLSYQYISNLAGVYAFMRRYDVADTLWDRVTWLAPDWAWGYAQKARLHIAWRGDIERAAQILGRGALHARRGTLELEKVRLLQLARRYDEALDALQLPHVLLNETDEPRDSALYLTIQSQLLSKLGSEQTANENLEQALTMIKRRRVGERPDDHQELLRIGKLYAELGLKTEAVSAAENALKLVPLELDFLSGSGCLIGAAEIYTVVGEFGRAITLLDQALSVPSLISVAQLNVEPRWDALRNNPDFKALLAEYVSKS